MRKEVHLHSCLLISYQNSCMNNALAERKRLEHHRFLLKILDKIKIRTDYIA